MKPNPWTIETVRPDSHIIRFGLTPRTEQWVMLRSDAHHDNPMCRQELERRDLELAKKRAAIIVDAGDLFCAMQGKYDPRSSLDDLRPEHKVERYLDALVDTAAEFYKPYAKQFALIGRGNHDTNIRKRTGTDLVERLVGDLRRAGSQVQAGQYSGWVTFRIRTHKTVTQAKILHYHHGSGGGGPVTRDVIRSNRMAVVYPDADIVMSGHTHDQWILPIKRLRLTTAGTPYQDIAWHIKTPTYKDEHQDGMGYAVEKMLNPKPLGCVWLRFYLATPEHSQMSYDRVNMDAIGSVE